MAMLRFASDSRGDMYSSRSSGRSRRYSHSRSPVAPSMAWMTSRGLGMYSTPSYATGVPCWLPALSARDQTIRNRPTLSRSTWSSGL